MGAHHQQCPKETISCEHVCLREDIADHNKKRDARPSPACHGQVGNFVYVGGERDWSTKKTRFQDGQLH